MAKQSTADRVVRSFLWGKSDRSGAMVSTGDAVYTYSVKLAGKDANGVYVTRAMAQRYSVTSSRHQRAVMNELPGNTRLMYGEEQYGTLADAWKERG